MAPDGLDTKIFFIQKANPINSQLSSALTASAAKGKGMLDEDHELCAIPRQTSPGSQRQ